jgi:hypothetical protein
MVRGADSRYSTAPINPRGVGKLRRLVRSDDPIPEGHIRLSQAFDLYYEAVTPNWQGLDAAINEHIASPPAAGKDGEATNPLVVASNARDAARGAAEMKFRKALAAGELRALIRDPDNGRYLSCRGTVGKGRTMTGGSPPALTRILLSLATFFSLAHPPLLTVTCGPSSLRTRSLIVARSVPGRDAPSAFASLRRQNLREESGALAAPAVHVRGRKPSYPRASIRKWVFELMGHHDEFSLDDPEWKSQADLERAILHKFALSGKTPAESTVRALIREPLAQWRAQKAGN